MLVHVCEIIYVTSVCLMFSLSLSPSLPPSLPPSLLSPPPPLSLSPAVPSSNMAKICMKKLRVRLLCLKWQLHNSELCALTHITHRKLYLSLSSSPTCARSQARAVRPHPISLFKFFFSCFPNTDCIPYIHCCLSEFFPLMYWLFHGFGWY